MSNPNPLEVTLGAAPIPAGGTPPAAFPITQAGRPRAAVLPEASPDKAQAPKPEDKEEHPEAGVEVTEEYQATDAQGNPIGTPTKVIGKGKTEAEAYKDLAGKLKAIHIAATRKMAEWKSKYREYDESRPLPAFEPVQLSAEEKMRLQRELNDPETMEGALDTLLQARLGVSPEDYRRKLASEAEQDRIARGGRETQLFLDDNPDFPAGAESRQAMEAEFQAVSQEREKAGKGPLDWTAHNLELVYQTLIEKGILRPLQIGGAGDTSQGQSAVTPGAAGEKVNPAEPTTRTRPRGERHSSMTPAHSSLPQGGGTGQPSSDDAEFLKMVRSLPLPELRRRIRSDAAFAKRLNSIKL